jgi:hypothetical protein
MLWQIEISIANGKTTPQACKEAEFTLQTFSRVAEGIRRSEDGPGQATEGTGKREWLVESKRQSKHMVDRLNAQPA